MITIVDYGMGNLRSVQKALEKLGHSAVISDSPEQIATAEKLILPGVGAFRDAIAQLNKKKLTDPILNHIQADKPFLGICLGLQLLFDVSYEDGTWEGLGAIPGKVVRFEDQDDLKVPHMGWNRLNLQQDSPLLSGLPDEPFVYFVHSYHVVPEDSSVIATTTDHGMEFVSMIQQGNLFATQFHPEKSQQTGLKILSQFAGQNHV